MNSFLGIEMTNHQAFVLLATLSVICVAMFIGGAILDYYGEKHFKYDYSICGCWLQVFGGLGFIVFTMLTGCFK